MDACMIAAGGVYEDHEGIDRYVVSIDPAIGRKLACVHWRRPGQFATRIESLTISSFAAQVRRVTTSSVEPAAGLPNNGMASVET